MKIQYKNNEEKKQILDVLLNLGYSFHGSLKYKTSDQIIEEWGGYSAVEIDYSGGSSDEIQLTSTPHNAVCWATDYASILGKLKNFKINNEIIYDVGDYRAIVSKENVEINGQSLTHEKVLEVYNAFNIEDLSEYFEDDQADINVNVKNSKERNTLIGILYGNGYHYHSEPLDVAIDELNEYSQITIHRGKTIGGNYRDYTPSVSLNFDQDLYKIVEKITSDKKSMVIDEVGEYSAEVYKNIAVVGCQRIPKEKIEEIVKAIGSFKS
jgi:hypothetical protein